MLLAGVFLLALGALVVNGLVSSTRTAQLTTVYRTTDYTVPQAAPTPAPTPAPARAATAGTSVSQSWVDAMAAKAGIPAVAMDAYARAELAAPCHVGWTTLAGIGWVESQNGTIGGRTLSATGYPSTPIYGPRLRGALGRAYGPMQIIPSTWDEYATDGDGDGTASPQDIFDAALTAARYLCATDQDLSTASGWASAIFSYNHSQHYVDQVYAAATAYDQRTR